MPCVYMQEDDIEALQRRDYSKVKVRLQVVEAAVFLRDKLSGFKHFLSVGCKSPEIPSGYEGRGCR